ncbi:FkbM family methyltransferase [Mycolicibacterium austroafricanum]|uniref:FkbM family methyltransferase n=1 Tax=Mycolicibacterium austroafricanum TaxID=39687 RepID=UPI001EECF941|nr:FkbM family methyltransferase [Mycolicibacterium austroafricanum]
MRLLDALDLRGRVALDVGAHSGNWTVNLASRVGRGGLVVAYEALPHYGRSLAMALRLLRVSNARVRIVAAGDTERTTGLRWRTDSNERLTGKTHIEPNADSSAGVIQVQMVSLDRDLEAGGIQLDSVGFIKIDVEGAELEVLRGASKLLSIGRPVVYLETEPEWIERLGHEVKDVFDEMSRYHYSPYLVEPGGITPTVLDSYLAQYAGLRAYNNVLFLPADSP